MSLVADALHHVEPLRRTRQDDRIGRTGYKDFLVLFCQAHRGTVDTQLLQHLHSGAELPFAAVDNNQVGYSPVVLQGSFFLRLFGASNNLLVRLGLPAKSPAQHLLEAGKIVWPFDRFNLEASIFARLGTARLENNHRPYRIRALGIGDVVTFNTVWWGCQIKLILDLLKPHLRFLALVQPFTNLLLYHFLPYLFDHFDQAQLFAAFRYGNGNCAPAFFP